MKIMITGGTGFLGSKLAEKFLSQGHQVYVFSRSEQKVKQQFSGQVHALTSWDHAAQQENYDVIINLAGAPIIGGRWTKARKQIIRDSRIGLTQQLVKMIAKLQHKPALLISGSAVGIYGDQGDVELTEKSHSASCFSQRLCTDWEYGAQQAEQFGVRVCIIRTGLVLGKDGGMLKQMLLPFQFGFGGTLGNGQQWMSWIHVNDWLAIVEQMIEDNRMAGPYNATAPHPVSNRQLTETLAKILHRPTLLPLPAFFLKILLGEMSELLLGSQRVLPERLLAKGFQFRYPELHAALENIIVHSINAH